MSWIVRDPRQDGTDISALKSEIDSLKNIIASIQTDISDANNFTIIYPNGGTKRNPATVTVNQRYVNDNPFPGYYVRCEAQIKIEGNFGSVDWVFNAPGGYGIFSGQLLPDDKIITQTGRSALCTNSPNGGNPFGNSSDISSAPCRVLVYKLGKIT